MKKKNMPGKTEEQDVPIKVFSTENMKTEFLPWLKGERGAQTYIKLTKKGQFALLYAGAGSVLQAEIQKALIKLTNDGWNVEGDVQITFDGAPDILSDRLLARHEITIEIGAALLPLIDPINGAPLLERLNAIREDLAPSLGFIVPGINVKDNMLMPPNAYTIKVRESPVASFELYLDRMIAIGSQEDLQKITGWSVTEPTYRMAAKWIETKDRASAEHAGCLVQGPLNVILTHISDTISKNASKILGLQETYNLLADFSSTHPVLVEEFLENIPSIRNIRKIFLSLLEENISLSDLITIMEVIGEHSDELSSTSRMVDYVRQALAAQICWNAVDTDGYMRAITFGEELENQLKLLVTDALGGSYMRLTEEQENKLIKLIKEVSDNLETPPSIITDPALRTHIRSLLSSHKIDLKVISASEIIPEIKIVFTGEVKGDVISETDKMKAKKKKEAGIFWSKKINQPQKRDS